MTPPSSEVGTLRGAAAKWRTLDAGKLRWLGRAGSYQYATHDKAEYAISLRGFAPEEAAPGRGEIAVAEETEAVVDGTRWGSRLYRRGFPVPTGTYDREQAKRERRRPANKPARAWDALAAAVPSLKRRDPERFATERAGSDPIFAVARSWVRKTKPPAVVEVGGTPGVVERSPAGYVAWLAADGVELSAPKGRLLVRSRRPLKAEQRALIELAEELLVGEILKRPVPCAAAECDSRAEWIVIPRTPVCAAHAGEEVAR